MKIEYVTNKDSQSIHDIPFPFLVKHKTFDGLYLVISEYHAISIGNAKDKSVNCSLTSQDREYFADGTWELYDGSITLSN